MGQGGPYTPLPSPIWMEASHASIGDGRGGVFVVGRRLHRQGWQQRGHQRPRQQRRWGGGGGGGGGGATDDTAAPTVDGLVTGTLRLQLYREDSDGVREYLDWADAYTTYPFGAVFLAATTEGPSGDLDYPGTAVTTADAVDVVNGNPYEISVKMSAAEEVRVYASVDYSQDGILGSDEPVGVYPAEILVEGSDTIDSVDITVLLPYSDLSKKGGKGTGTSGCTDLTVSGEVVLDRPYDGGQVAVMLLDTAGEGPYEYTYTLLQTNDNDTATGTYAFPTCANYGSFALRGAWDSNANSLIDPADLWGSYINEDEEDGNPITIGSADLQDYNVAIPLGSAGLSVIPFTEVRGTLRVGGGSFDALPKETTAIYIVALKYSPDQDMTVDFLYERSYDVEVITPKDYAGESSIDFALGVPADSVLYLWAYADNNGDESVNGPGEYVGSGGGSNGRILTTEGINDGNVITIGVVSNN